MDIVAFFVTTEILQHYFKGNMPSKMRLYRMAIGSNLDWLLSKIRYIFQD